jgi:beta-lactamase regulating signal transducer with metallopeptidase domain
MNTVTVTFNALVERVTWALVHSLWQGSAIAIALGIALYLLRGASARARYAVACVALVLMVVLPVGTAVLYDITPRTGAAEWVGAGENGRPVAVGDADAIYAVASARPSSETRGWAPPSISMLRPWIFGCWLAGMLAVSLFHAAGWRRVQRMRVDGAEEAPAQWQRISGYLGARLGLSRVVPVLRSTMVEVPTVIGWLRPVVLIPAAALIGLHPEELGSILAHELAHISRRDYLVNLVQVAAETLFFYHPAVWWVSRQIRAERELCCDDLAVEVMGSRSTYARALVRMEAFRFDRPAFALRADGGSLAHRIRRLTGGNPMHNQADRPRLSGILLASMLLISAAIVGGVTSRSSSAPPAVDVAPFALAQTDGGTMGTYTENDGDFDETGRWELGEGRGYQRIQMWEGSRRNHRWSIGTRIAPDEFTGLQEGENVEFAMRREAGTFYFRGDVEEDGAFFEGDGRFGFVASDEYVKEMEELGVTGLDENDLMLLAIEDVGTDFVRQLNALGYERVSGRRLVELAIHGVTIDFIEGMHERGYEDVRLSRFAEMRIHGVTLEFVDAMTAEGFENPSVDRLVEWRIHGVDPRFVEEMRAAGFDVSDSDAVVKWRIHGVTPEFIQEMADLDIDVDDDDVVKMRIHGVSPEFVHEMRAMGYDHMSVDRMVQWRIHGVTPEYIDAFRKLGYDDLDSRDLVQMRIHGVRPDDVRELSELGYRNVDVDTLVQMRIHGVSPSWIRRMQKKGLKDVPLDDLIKMRIHGIDLE